MKDDIRFRFWGHLGYDVTAGVTYTADAATAGAELGSVHVETLLPSRSDIILQHVPGSERAVLVGTYQALDMIRRRSKDPRPERAAKRKSAEDLLQLLATFDLILVDEGHYEPAVSWSKGVRELNRPTVLLSATPYRNDFNTHSLRRTKATLICRRTGNLRAVQLLLSHTKIESTVRYLGIEVDDALSIAEQVDL
jgi:site-specific recombinase XerD